MFDNTPNARQLAKLMADARHQYSSPEEIAKAYEQKSGYSCTPEQIESILELLNSQGVVCFDEKVIYGVKKYCPLYYMKWYPDSRTIRRRAYNWQQQYRKLSRQKVCDYPDIFFHEWLMGGHGCPVLSRANFYTLCNPDLFRRPENLLNKLSTWGEISTEEVAGKMEEAVTACWQVRKGRELLVFPNHPGYMCDAPAFMTWQVFLWRLRVIIGGELNMELGYTIFWDNGEIANGILDTIEKSARVVNLVMV